MKYSTGVKHWRLLFLAGLAAGCARFERQPLSPSDNAATIESRTLTDPGLRTFLETNAPGHYGEWPLSRWNLDSLTLAAFYFQPRLAVARADWGIARAGEQTAGQRPNPTLNITPGYNTTMASPSPWLPLGYVDIPIETAGKRGYRREQAAHLSAAARWRLAATAWQVRSDLRSNLTDYVVDQRRIELLEKRSASEARALKLMEERVQAGIAASPEVVTFRIAWQKTQLDLAEARRAKAAARARVAALVGVPDHALEKVELDYELTGGLNPPGMRRSTELRRDALHNRADVLSGLAEYAAAEAALGLEIARQYPDVHLQPGYQFDQGENKWSLGLTVDLPVLHQNQGPIKEAQARRAAAAARFTEVQSKVVSEIDQAEAELAMTEAAAVAIRSLADAEARRRDSVRAQANAGAADLLDVTNAETEYLNAQAIQLESTLRLQKAVGMLEDAVQRPWELMAVVYQTPPYANH